MQKTAVARKKKTTVARTVPPITKTFLTTFLYIPYYTSSRNIFSYFCNISPNNKFQLSGRQLYLKTSMFNFLFMRYPEFYLFKNIDFLFYESVTD